MPKSVSSSAEWSWQCTSLSCPSDSCCWNAINPTSIPQICITASAGEPILRPCVARIQVRRHRVMSCLCLYPYKCYLCKWFVLCPKCLLTLWPQWKTLCCRHQQTRSFCISWLSYSPTGCWESWTRRLALQQLKIIIRYNWRQWQHGAASIPDKSRFRPLRCLLLEGCGHCIDNCISIGVPE